EIGDWYEPQHGGRYRVALQAPNAHYDKMGLFAFGWNNPNPEKTIKQLEFISKEGQGIVVLAAVTLSQKPVTLPDPKDIPQPEYQKVKKRSQLALLDIMLAAWLIDDVKS